MSVSEARRHQLYEALRATIGQQDAETFMDLTPPVDWPDVATKGQLDALEHVTNARFDAFERSTNARFDALERSTNARFDAIEQRMATKNDIAELRTEIATVKSDLSRTFGTWLFASQAGVIAAVSVIMALLR